ncbi:TPA: hypothetical protein ACKQAY_000182 [Stenotrophomonas maltophilia]
MPTQLIDASMAQVFSSFRAEHDKLSLAHQFTQPGYFPELLTLQPCFLIGGRGTGKTTTLQSLSYRVRLATPPDRIQGRLDDLGIIGLYHKINTGRVAAFQGPELDQSEWDRLFGHYLNLTLVVSILEFFAWRESNQEGERSLPSEVLDLVATIFSCMRVGTASGALLAVKSEMADFETAINSIGRKPNLRLTPLGMPIDSLLDSIADSGVVGDASFYFLIDEFENLSNYQQRIVNTLVKHSRPPYTFKIGVKELGVRERCTVNATEQLIDPADFRRIDISERLTSGASFEVFAAQVCARRARLDDPEAVRSLFPGISADDEALKLGIERVAQEPVASVFAVMDSAERERFKTYSLLEQYCLFMLEDGSPTRVRELMRTTMDSSIADRLNNYKIPILFSLKQGKRGFRKYYCGWDVLCKLANGNIRYLLELVHRSIYLQLESGPSSHVSIEAQTEAARLIGQKNLRELEGLSVLGGRMTKLALSLGRVFQVMALSPLGHTPEVTQFRLESPPSVGGDRAAQELLEQCVMHLALVRRPGTKLQQSEDIRDYDYSLHPIFSAYFEYSYRQKRKMLLTSDDIISLSEGKAEGIRAVLLRQNREGSIFGLPSQMDLGI